MKSFEFNTLFIIESLKPGETKTGLNLYDEMCTLKAAHNELSALDLRYVSIASAQEWDDCMAHILRECKERKVLPIIHLEIHGNKNGIEFTNLECRDRYEVSRQFREINRVIGCNLFTTLGVCEGLNILFGIKTDELMPFCGVVGSFDKLIAADIEIRYSEFYRTLFTKLDIYEAYKSLIHANTELVADYRYIPVDEIFYKNYQDYLDKECTLESMKRRALNSFDQQSFYANTRQQKRKFVRDFIKEEKKNRLNYYQESVSSFFDLEHFPQNKERFEIPDNFKALKEKYDTLII